MLIGLGINYGLADDTGLRLTTVPNALAGDPPIDTVQL